MSNYLRNMRFFLKSFIENELKAERASLNLVEARCSEALIHGHCHQKTARSMAPVEALLKRIPGMKVSVIETSCCGMAGHFGYQKETLKESLAMAELNLLPAVREANATARIVADGTSCRHQIADNTPRQAEHVAVLLAEHLRRINPLNSNVIVRAPLHVQVAERLRLLIDSGELAPGTRLNENELCQNMGVSRTPCAKPFAL